VERAGMLVEKAVAAVTQELVKRGVGKLVIAGGETAGVCVRALGIRKLRIGRQIDPGVPWCYAESPLSVTGGQHIALKSGNFGREDFFTRAFTLLA
jgi:3-dehydrotetronate 4-kinase